MPTLIVFRDGRAVKRLVGARGKASLREELEDAGARVNHVLLQVYREVADLAEQEAPQPVPGLT